jgi:hypothetical protein
MVRFSYELIGWGYWDWSLPNITTQEQLKALSVILANVREYKRQPILFSLRNQRNRPPLYNYFRIGHKPLIAVLNKLEQEQQLKITKGTPRFAKGADGEDLPPCLSSFVASQELLDMAYDWISDDEVLHFDPLHLELRSNDKEKHLIEFERDAYTDLVQTQMSGYCGFINEQCIEVGGKLLGELKLVRHFKDWAGDGSVLFGGRVWHPFMSLSKRQRRKFKINGSKVACLDYPASVPNLLYRMMTGERLSPTEDPYAIDGLSRLVGKQSMKFLLNTKGFKGAEIAMKNWLTDNKSCPKETLVVSEAVAKLGSVRNLLKLVVARNEPIRACLMLGADMGQHYQWLEANLVFHVAHQLSLIGIPALTVHDEFIVRERDKAIAEELMYSLWPENLPTLAAAPWNKVLQTQHKAA